MNFTTKFQKILDLKSSSEQLFSEICRWVPLESERLSKLSLEGRRIILPDPDTLIEGWEDSAFSYPELSQINVEKYWDESELSIVFTIKQL